MPTIDIHVKSAPHQFMIERGLLKRIGQILREMQGHERALIVADARIRDSHGRRVEQSMNDAGFDTHVVELEADEKLKSLDSVQTLYENMLAHRMERRSPVVAVGGGLIGDVAGFAAATYLRGVPIVQVPTTLLAMVDASIGGKTAVNHPVPGGGVGKNLIGAFWQPAVILADPQTLPTLDDRDFRCGIAECIKHALLAAGMSCESDSESQSGREAGQQLLELLRDHPETILNRDLRALTELITQSAAIKIRIVQEDEREAGRRVLLNLGHTFAHAIEPIEELNLRHGEAVAVGLCAAARCSVRLGRLTEPEADAIEEFVVRYKLPKRLPEPVLIDRLMNLMLFDKKTASEKLRLILPVSEGGVDIVNDVPTKVIRATWSELGAAER